MGNTNDNLVAYYIIFLRILWLFVQHIVLFVTHTICSCKILYYILFLSYHISLMRTLWLFVIHIIITLRAHLFGAYCHLIGTNRIGGVMASALASSAVDRLFEPLSGQTKDYTIGMCCFSAKHTALRRKNKDWLARIHDNVSEWGDMTIHRLLFQWTSTIKLQLGMLI